VAAPTWQRWLRYQTLFRPLGVLPLPLAYRGAGWIGRWDGRDPALRTLIGNGLRRVFPVQTREPATLDTWVDGYFRMMARETLDVYTMPRVHRDSHLVDLHPQALAVLHEARRDGRGVIIAMGHYSRLNLLLLALALAGQRLGMLTIAVDQRNPDLNAVERGHLQRKVGNLHARIQGPWITLEDNLRHLYQALGRGETMIILFDAFVPGDTAREPLPFLGGRLWLARGVERLAQRTNAALLYGVVHERGWRTQAELRALPGAPGAALDAAVAELARDVGNAPWLWWQWNILDYFWTPGGETP